MLDETMMYSARSSSRRDQPLEEASRAKLEPHLRQARPAAVRPRARDRDRLGRVRAARRADRGCRVTTTTLSREQRDLALERVREAGLSDRVTVLLDDYRELTGTYDKLVSIEMIEAVGWKDFGTFFDRCARCCARRRDGAAGDHDRRPRSTSREGQRSFIELADLPERLPAVGRGDRAHRRAPTDMRIGRPRGHHAALRETLRRWRANVEARRAAAELGYDERFQRLWRLYLCFCEAGFTARRISDVQMLLAKPRWRGMLGADARRGGGEGGGRLMLLDPGGAARVHAGRERRAARAHPRPRSGPADVGSGARATGARARRDRASICRGFGGSRAVSPRARSISAGFVAASVVALGVSRPQVAGVSLGGWVALELALAGEAVRSPRSRRRGCGGSLWSRGARPRAMVARALSPVLPLILRSVRGRQLALSANVGHPGSRAVLGCAAAREDVRALAGFAAVERGDARVAVRPARRDHRSVTLAWPDLDRIVGRPRALPGNVRKRGPARVRAIAPRGTTRCRFASAACCHGAPRDAEPRRAFQPYAGQTADGRSRCDCCAAS
jgi:cyclopropane fatty-acyl-phospholipid synthase-like methyltransferase